MAIAFFVLGFAGSGKTNFSKKWVKARLVQKEAWALLDKDVSGAVLAEALMRQMGLDPRDKDSVAYKQHVRDLEYQTCLDIAQEQLRLGINVVLPAPWTKELTEGRLFDIKSLGFPEETKLMHVYLDANEEQVKERIVKRKKSRDQWKLDHWEEFAKTLVCPPSVQEHQVLKLLANWDFEKKEKVVNEHYRTMLKG